MIEEGGMMREIAFMHVQRKDNRRRRSKD